MYQSENNRSFQRTYSRFDFDYKIKMLQLRNIFEHGTEGYLLKALSTSKMSSKPRVIGMVPKFFNNSVRLSSVNEKPVPAARFHISRGRDTATDSNTSNVKRLIKFFDNFTK